MSRQEGLTRDAGRLRFKTAYRVDSGDRGPVAELYAELIPGEWKEIFRYDCFANSPHRHHWDAAGVEERVEMKGVESMDDGVAFTRKHFRTGLMSSLRSLGYEDFVDDLDSAEVARAAEAAISSLESLATEGR